MFNSLYSHTTEKSRYPIFCTAFGIDINVYVLCFFVEHNFIFPKIPFPDNNLHLNNSQIVPI